MGRDFNPRNWAVNRAKCQVLAGGVVDSTLTRSFLDTGPPYAETGWAIVAPAPLEAIDGRTVGALTLISGLDRIGLASYLRRHDVTVRVVRSGQELVDGIAGGQFDGGVTEALLAGGLAADNDWWVASLPDELARYNLVFGLWKGDLTLKRKIVQAFRQLESDGTLAAILERYGAAPIGDRAAPSPPCDQPSFDLILEDDRRQHGVGRAEKLADQARRHRHEQHGGKDPLCPPRDADAERVEQQPAGERRDRDEAEQREPDRQAAGGAEECRRRQPGRERQRRQRRQDQGVEKHGQDKQADEAGQDDDDNADPTDAELPCVDGHGLRPAESEEDHADRADEIDMAGRHDGQAAVVFRSLVAQDRPPPPRRCHHELRQ